MKKFINTLLIVLLLIISGSAKAATLTNEEYNRLRLLYTDARISIMSDEEAQKYLSYDLENTQKVSKFYKIEETTNGTITKEVTETEARTGNTSRAASVTTSYKNLQIARTKISGNKYQIDLINVWLTTPVIKSFDVMALRYVDATVVSGTQDGTQIYKKNGSYDGVNYSYNGTNMKITSNGFGVSMNLVDGATDFENYLQVNVIATSTSAKIYGSYQHAAANVTLAQSQAYNISHNGYGEVINFSTSVENIYDGMKGVSLAIDYTA